MAIVLASREGKSVAKLGQREDFSARNRLILRVIKFHVGEKFAVWGINNLAGPENARPGASSRKLRPSLANVRGQLVGSGKFPAPWVARGRKAFYPDQCPQLYAMRSNPCRGRPRPKAQTCQGLNLLRQLGQVSALSLSFFLLRRAGKDNSAVLKFSDLAPRFLINKGVPLHAGTVADKHPCIVPLILVRHG